MIIPEDTRTTPRHNNKELFNREVGKVEEIIINEMNQGKEQAFIDGYVSIEVLDAIREHGYAIKSDYEYDDLRAWTKIYW